MKESHYLICASKGLVLTSNEGHLYVKKGDKFKIIKQVPDGYACTYIPGEFGGATEKCYIFTNQIDEGSGVETDSSDLATFYYQDNKTEEEIVCESFQYSSCPDCGKTIRNNKCGRCGYGLDPEWKEAIVNKKKQIQAAQVELAKRHQMHEANSKPEILQIAKTLKFPKPTSITPTAVSWYKRGGHAGDKAVYRVLQAAKDLNWTVKKDTHSTHPAYDIVTNIDALLDPTGRFYLETYIKYGVAAYENSFTINLRQITVQESSTSICNQCKRTKAKCLCPKTDQFMDRGPGNGTPQAAPAGEGGMIGEAEDISMFDLGTMDYVDNFSKNHEVKTNLAEAPTSKNAVAFKEILPIVRTYFTVYKLDKEHQKQAFRVWITTGEDVLPSELELLAKALGKKFGTYSYESFMKMFSYDNFTMEKQGKRTILITIFKKLKGGNFLKYGIEESLDKKLKHIENIWKKKLNETPEITLQGNEVMADGQSLKSLEIDKVIENIVIFRETSASFLFPAGKTWGYFMDSPESAKKMRSGEYEMLFFPIVPRFNISVNPMDAWRRNGKRTKGAEHVLGIWDGVIDNKEIFVDKIAVKKAYRKASIASKMMDIFRKYYPNRKITITGTTNDGQNFLSKYAKVPKNDIHKDGETYQKDNETYRSFNKFDKNLNLLNPKSTEEESTNVSSGKEKNNTKAA